MAGRSVLGDEAAAYVAAHCSPPTALQAELIAETYGSAEIGPFAGMQISADQGAFMSVLTAALQPRFVVEIGTFTGYSALTVAAALGPDARMLCCDVSEEWTAIARRYWRKAGVDHKIELVIAPALETLAARSDDPPVDLAFIDADKTGYLDYYEALLPRLSERGLILVDNTLWSGRTPEAPRADDDADTKALREFNDHVAADPRAESALLAVGDGVTMIRHR